MPNVHKDRITKFIEIAQKLKDAGINVNRLPKERQVQNEGKKKKVKNTLQDLVEQGEISNEILERLGLDGNYKIGYYIENAQRVYRGVGARRLTEQEKRQLEELGIVSSEIKKSYITEFIEIAQKLKDVGINVNRFPKERQVQNEGKEKKAYNTLQDLVEQGEISNGILEKLGLNGNYKIGYYIEKVQRVYRGVGAKRITEEEKMQLEKLGIVKKALNRYEKIDTMLKKCFKISFGDKEKQGIISMEEIKEMLCSRAKPDFTKDIPENKLIEFPENIYEVLEDTYINRNAFNEKAYIGCARTSSEQMDGIIKMALLIHISDFLSKKYENKLINEIDIEKKKTINEKKEIFSYLKEIALSDIIASIYVLSKTSSEYNDYISYGVKTGNGTKSAFVIDLPYIDQISICFDSEKKQKEIIKNAHNNVKMILENKLRLRRITREQLKNITLELEQNDILPEYKGILYELDNVFPMEYIGQGVKEYRKIIGNKLPEEVTMSDIKNLITKGLNKRELYYFLIKIGADKELLDKELLNKLFEEVNLQKVETENNDIPIKEICMDIPDSKKLDFEKGQEER